MFTARVEDRAHGQVERTVSGGSTTYCDPSQRMRVLTRALPIMVSRGRDWVSERKGDGAEPGRKTFSPCGTRLACYSARAFRLPLRVWPRHKHGRYHAQQEGMISSIQSCSRDLLGASGGPGNASGKGGREGGDRTWAERWDRRKRVCKT